MNRAVQQLALLVTTVLMIVSIGPSALATTASTNPVLTSATLESATTLQVGDQIRIRWTIAYEKPITRINFAFRTPSGSLANVYSYAPDITTSGTESSGVSISTTDNTLPPGEYRLEFVQFLPSGESMFDTRYGNTLGPDVDLSRLTFNLKGTSADSTSPVLTSATMESGATLRVGDRIRIRWTAEDESPVDYVSFRVLAPDGRLKYVNVNESAPTTTGTVTSGVSLSEQVSSLTWPAGEYRVEYALFRDRANNYSDTRYGNTLAPGVDVTKLTFNVEGTSADTTSPVLTSATSESAATLHVGDKVSIRWTAEDENPVRGVSFRVRAPDGQIKYVSANASAPTTTGTVTSGVSLSEQVSSLTWPAGEYRVEYAFFSDTANNTSDTRYGNYLGPGVDFTKLTFSVEGTSADTTYPVLTAATFESAKTLHMGDMVKIRWTVTDESPIRYLAFAFTAPDGRTRILSGRPSTVIGKEQSGVVSSGVNTLDWVAGEYRLQYVTFTDSAGHTSDSRRGSVAGPGVDLTQLSFSIQPPAPSLRLNYFKGDSKTDVIARDSTGELWLYPSTRYYSIWDTRIDLGPGWNTMTSIVTPGEFNGDGKADLIARDTGGELWLYPGTGTGDWFRRVSLGSGWNVMTSIVGPGDFNGDGKPDLIARDSSGELWLYPNNGAGDWHTRIDLGPGWNIMSSILAPGDFNEDGKVDLLARDTSGGFWLYPGNGSNEWLTRISLGSGWNGLTALTAPGDLNFDARPDVVARDTSGNLWLYPNNGAGDWFGRQDLGPGWNQMTAIL